MAILPVGGWNPQSGITVTQSSHHYIFAQQASFTLSASSDSEITAVYLFLRPEGAERATVERMEVAEGSKEINVTYRRDLRQFPLPVFSEVSYWWQVEDAAHNSLTTETQTFTYDDNRFIWQETGAGRVQLHWVYGDAGFAQAVLDIAQASLEQLNGELQAPLPEVVRIYIYPTLPDLQSGLALAGRDWMGGQARPGLGVVLIAIPPDENAVPKMERDLPHEITHLLIYQATGVGYEHVPTWLNEGLATANERRPTPEYELALQRARAEGRLLPLESLCGPFPLDAQTALLSYAQSGSLVQFIRDRYGSAAIRVLLAAYGEGATCEGGVARALDTSLSGLDTAWRAQLEEQSGWEAVLEKASIWLALWLLSLLVALPMVGHLRRRR